MQYSTLQKLTAEFLGTAFLLATIAGSGIMADTLSGGNIGLALLANSICVGAILYVLITMLGPISGAHFNPAVTLAFFLKKEIIASMACIYVVVQIAGAISGVWLTHLMFEQDILQLGTKIRSGYGQFFGEVVATFGLVFIIFATIKARAEAVPAAVGLYITAGIWFTSSTALCNPAVTIARSFTDTFTGMRPQDIFLFVIAQLIGTVLASIMCMLLLRHKKKKA